MDFTNITACGGDCTGCEHYKSGIENLKRLGEIYLKENNNV